MVKTRDLGLTPFDELFETSESRLERQKEKVEKIPLDRIDPFPSHPFQVRKDEAMTEMAESIRQFGVLTPAVLRPTENERYEMESESCTPSLAQAIKLKRFSLEGRLGEDVILSILQEEKPNQVEQFKMPRERISRFFAPGTSREKMEETIVKALEFYRKRQREMER